MRTTITIDEGLAADLKRLASQQGKSLSAVIAEALRAQLAKRAESPKTAPFRLVTVKGGKLRPGVDVNSLKGIEEMDDIERWKHRRRGGRAGAPTSKERSIPAETRTRSSSARRRSR
jgi:hypothetical protein